MRHRSPKCLDAAASPAPDSEAESQPRSRCNPIPRRNHPGDRLCRDHHRGLARQGSRLRAFGSLDRCAAPGSRLRRLPPRDTLRFATAGRGHMEHGRRQPAHRSCRHGQENAELDSQCRGGEDHSPGAATAGRADPFLVVPGEGTGGVAAATAPAILSGSIQQAALAHPLVQRAKEIFKAEVRSVVDLRVK